jgi:hypothetical protein
MQRKQQVGECWVYVIFFACVCVGASGSTTASDDPSSSALCVVCVGHFLGGSQGGPGMPPLVTCSVRHRAVARGRWGSGQCPEIFFWAVFAIFSGFCYF